MPPPPSISFICVRTYCWTDSDDVCLSSAFLRPQLGKEKRRGKGSKRGVESRKKVSRLDTSKKEELNTTTLPQHTKFGKKVSRRPSGDKIKEQRRSYVSLNL
eukprot:scaffold6665_cov53-Attheya_sp.AAC.7